MNSPVDPKLEAKQLRLLQLDEALDLQKTVRQKIPTTDKSLAITSEPSPLEDEVEPDLSRFVRSLKLLHQAGFDDRQQIRQANIESTECNRDDWDSLEVPQLRERYQFIKRLGQGGFGVVLLALDRHLNRLVALKLPRGNVVLTRSMIQRFLREAQHVAQLDHPNIVKVLGTDDASALPIIIYAYCDGPTLAEWLAKREEPVSLDFAVRLGIILGEAMQHAHRRGIVHRDLKPSNILLESATLLTQHALQDGEQVWIPRITDFGISKDATRDGSEQTTIGTVLGTFQYMAPEQVEARSADIGWHSDVYSLGVILFEVVTRTNPFAATEPVGRIRQMHSQLPLVRKLRPDADRDLEAVLAKCLQPIIDDRYANAQELVDDLKNILDGQPVSVRPVSTLLRLHRWAYRQPIVAALSAVCILLLLLALLLSATYLLQTRQSVQLLTAMNSQLAEASRDASLARQREAEASSKLADQLYSSDMQAAASALRSKDMHSFTELMQRQSHGTLLDSERDMAFDFLRSRGQRTGQLLVRLTSGITRMQFSQDGQQVLLATQDGCLHLIDTASQEIIRRIKVSDQRVTDCAYSPDGQLVAASSEGGSIHVHEVDTGRQIKSFLASTVAVFQVGWISDTELVVSGDEPTIRIWDWRRETVTAELKKHTRSVRALAVDRPRGQIISGGDDHQLTVWNSTNRSIVYEPHATSARIRDLSIASNRRWVMTCDVEGVVRKHCLYDDKIPLSELARARQAVECVAICPNERRVAFGSREGIIQCVTLKEDGNYPLEDLNRIGEAWLAHQGTVTDLAFSSDGQSLYSVSSDGAFYRWPAAQEVTRQCDLSAKMMSEPAGDLAIAEYDPDRCLLASNCNLYLWRPATDDFTHLCRAMRRVEQLLTSPALDKIILSYAHGAIQAIDKAPPYAEQWSFQSPGCESFCAVDYCPSRHWIAVSISQPANRIVILRADNGQLVYEFALPESAVGRSRWLEFSPDGMLLAVAIGKAIDIWNLENNKPTVLRGHTATVSAFNFSNDSRWLVSGSEDCDMRLWQVDSGQCISQLRHHNGEISSLLFSPDDRSIVSSDQRGESAIWSVRTRSLSTILDKQNGSLALPLTWKGPWLYRRVMPGTILADRVE